VYRAFRALTRPQNRIALLQSRFAFYEGAILKRPIQSTLARFAVNGRSKNSLSSQICEFVRGEILRGAVSPGSYLPSTRALAATLGVSRNTILQVYEILWADGLVDGRTGSGTRVNPALALRFCRPPALALTSQQILREAHYPARVRQTEDPDGNPVVIHD
jgi:DNA-binding transcriptional regulator YhcF (GntR family)